MWISEKLKVIYTYTHDCEGIPMLLLKYREKGTWGYHYVLVSYFLFHFFYAQQNVTLVGNHDS